MFPESGGGPLARLPYLRDCKSKRVSSYDRTGGNADFVRIEAGTTATIAEIEGAGCIRHIWMTVGCPDDEYLRKVLLRIYWDGETDPSVDCPLGDFFGVGHAMANHYMSLPLNMTRKQDEPGQAAGFNCYFPMPFGESARVEVVNECESAINAFYYYIDYEEYQRPPEDAGRFHAQWRRESPTKAVPPSDPDFGINLSGDENYVILNAEGKGHYVGCNLSVHNMTSGWFGEGDDMIFIDGEGFPPSLHGTGTEDYFGAAWAYPTGEYSGPYHGISLAGSTKDYTGKWTMYRFHIEDPICFDKSIRVTIEHGHANDRSDDLSSVAYWYQTEPHKAFPKMPSVMERLPLKKTGTEFAEDFCRDWLVVGPFENPIENDERVGLGIVHGPELEFDPDANYPGVGDRLVSWRRAHAALTGYLDLRGIFRPNEFVVAYALTNIYSAAERDACLLFGSDDGAKIWVNGEEVFTVVGDRGPVPDDDRIPIKLKSGWNRILVKVEQGDKGWGLYLRVSLAEGDLRYRAFPE